MQRVAILARSMLEVGIIDPAMLEEAVLDVLVDRHDGFDVLEVIQARAVRHLVQARRGMRLLTGSMVFPFHAKRETR